jgi:hypothetical protein
VSLLSNAVKRVLSWSSLDTTSDKRKWLQGVICILNLVADVLLVLNSSIEAFNGETTVSFLSDSHYPWARYAILYAGYKHRLTSLGIFSDQFMTVLEELALSEQPHIYSTPNACRVIFQRLIDQIFITGQEDLSPSLMGNDGRGELVLAPL